LTTNRIHARMGRLVDALAHKGYATIDTIAILAAHQRSASQTIPTAEYFDTTSHHSMLAHRILAEAMSERLSADGVVDRRGP